MLRFCAIFAALRKSRIKAPKCRGWPGPASLCASAEACVCVRCVRINVTAEDERTGYLKGCQVELVWLGPVAAAWIAHSESGLSVSAGSGAHLNVREVTARKSRAFIVRSPLVSRGKIKTTHTPHKKCLPVYQWPSVTCSLCVPVLQLLVHYMVTLLYFALCDHIICIFPDLSHNNPMQSVYTYIIKSLKDC